METEKEFSALENAVLIWIVENNKDPNVIAQIKTVRFVDRKWTKVGFFVNLEVSRILAPIGEISKQTIVSGPVIESEDIEFSATSFLFIKDGYLNFLEMAAAGSFFKETVSNFILRDK